MERKKERKNNRKKEGIVKWVLNYKLIINCPFTMNKPDEGSFGTDSKWNNFK